MNSIFIKKSTCHGDIPECGSFRLTHTDFLKSIHSKTQLNKTNKPMHQ